MFFRKTVSWLIAGQAIGWCAATLAQAPEMPPPPQSLRPGLAEQAEDERLAPPGGPSETLLQSLDSQALREIAGEVMERNPEIARAKQLAAAARVRAPQVSALPDPVAALTVFALPPETRVGPQRLSVSIGQKFPWFGKLALKEQAALYAAAAAEAEVETVRLDKLTETRRLAYELAFLDAHEEILAAERNTLVRYEKAGQARYAAGIGLQQEIVRVQAQITRTDTRSLEISERRSAVLAALNALRDRPADEPAGVLALPEPREPAFDRAALRREATVRRPELSAADARIAARAALIELAEKNFRPDLTFGLSYTAVGGREDAPGRANPPPDDGSDILALTGSLNLPVRRRKLAAGVEEAHAERWAAEEDKRRILAQIEGSIGDLTARMPLLFEHWHLLETVLEVQAREALRSAETAYSIGKLNAVDLLDAEVVLFDVRIATARTRTDLAVAQAQLERAVAHALKPLKESRDDDR